MRHNPIELLLVLFTLALACVPGLMIALMSWFAQH
jgi:hypothetical protein